MKRNTSLTYELEATYFVTTTVTNFTNLFNNSDLAEIIQNNIGFYVKKFKISLHAFVIMPNHLHLLFTMGKSGNVSEIIGRIKEYSAKQIIEYCEVNEENKLLQIFELSACKYKPKHKYQVWQSRFDDFRIRTEEQLEQKMEYIHQNPLQDHWRLVEKQEDYKYSSAGFYVNGSDVGLEITLF